MSSSTHLPHKHNQPAARGHTGSVHFALILHQDSASSALSTAQLQNQWNLQGMVVASRKQVTHSANASLILQENSFHKASLMALQAYETILQCFDRGF